jgi:hypothetical protein
MVRHETVGEDFHVESLAPFLEEQEIEGIVGIAEKCGLPSIASLRDVVRYIRHNHPSQSSHVLLPTGLWI